MKLDQKEIDGVIKYIQEEPRSIQDVSFFIKRSWVTTNKYLEEIKNLTGLIDIKTFRKGSHGALKIVYYVNKDMVINDEVKKSLYNQIQNGRKKSDFDFLDVYQFVDDRNKRLNSINLQTKKREKYVSFLNQAESMVYCFSGNLSFLNLSDGKISVLDCIEKLLKRKVIIKILCRVNVASINNLAKLSSLIKKYPNQIEVRHSYHPLRGFIIDDSIMRFKYEEKKEDYKSGELIENTRLMFEIFDECWISWMQNVFWNLYRTSIDYNLRLKLFVMCNTTRQANYLK